MENARLLDEIRQRQDELASRSRTWATVSRCSTRRTDLVAWNRNFQDILDVPDDIMRVV